MYDTRRKRAAPKKAGEEEEAEEPAAEARTLELEHWAARLAAWS